MMPYLLKDLKIIAPHQVWQVDITYLPTIKGFMYLVGFIDVYSRMTVGYNISNCLDTESCIVALELAIKKYGLPQIINSDQGTQFTSDLWKNSLQNQSITISMTGKGRSNDNAFIERLWKTLKYEGILLYNWRTVNELMDNIPNLIDWYNYERPHMSIGYLTPYEKLCEYNTSLLIAA